jgi:hypothetical protein
MHLLLFADADTSAHSMIGVLQTSFWRSPQAGQLQEGTWGQRTCLGPEQ